MKLDIPWGRAVKGAGASAKLIAVPCWMLCHVCAVNMLLPSISRAFGILQDCIENPRSAQAALGDNKSKWVREPGN